MDVCNIYAFLLRNDPSYSILRYPTGLYLWVIGNFAGWADSAPLGAGGGTNKQSDKYIEWQY